MARKIPLIASKAMNEINMTPMIDLSFLLLITFIITFPMMEQGIPVNLPKANSEKIKEIKKDSITITVDDKGTIFLDQVKMSPEQLSRKMKEAGKKDPNTVVLVRGDEKVRYGSVVRVLKILHEAKITKMSLITGPEDSGKR